MLAAIEEDEYGVLRGAVGALLQPVGETGRKLLKESVEARLAALEELADAAGDVDAYVAASGGEPTYDAKRHDIAERLLAAGRAEEALAWPAECGDFEPGRLVDLRYRHSIRLAGRQPVAAILLRRRQVEDVLKRASSTQYQHAVRELRDAAALAAGLADGNDLEPHGAWLARLRAEHGRKRRFWERLDQRR
ncbi:MAG: DUF6880 family protein [Geminicoccaceae bacterium]